MIPAFDTNQPISEGLANRLYNTGKRVAIRYYRRLPWPADQSCLGQAEVVRLHRAGLYTLPVFQHRSNRPDLFTPENAALDAKAAINRAHDVGQQDGSGIFFACDCDFLPSTIHYAIEYFKVINAIIRPRELFLIGAYGDDLVLQTLSDLDLIDIKWLANAKGWLDDKNYDGWQIKQSSFPYSPFIDMPNFQIDDDIIRLVNGDEESSILATGAWRIE